MDLCLLLAQTFGVLADCPGLHHDTPTSEIMGICGQLDVCTARDPNHSSSQVFDRNIAMRLWRKAKRMDRAFDDLYGRCSPSIIPSPTEECRSCMETLLPHNLPYENVTAKEMRDSLLTDYTVLGKVVGALTRMHEGCSRYLYVHHHITRAEIATKQLMCEIGVSLPSVGGDQPCGPLYPLLTSWCHTNNCFDWYDRNFLVMDKLIDTSQAVKSKYTHLLSSHVIYDAK